MITKNLALYFLLFGFLVLLDYPLLLSFEREKIGEGDVPTLFDMKYIPSDYECLLLANHTYGTDLAEGSLVQYSKKDFVTQRDKTLAAKRPSYAFLLLELTAIACFSLFIVYDCIFYLEKAATWVQTLKDNYYFMAILLLKSIGVAILAVDLHFAFLGTTKAPRTKSPSHNFENFNKKGWQVIKIFTSSRFKEHTSVLYINAEKTKMVLGIQGSSSWRDWVYTNLPTAIHQQPRGQAQLMVEVIEACIKEAKKRHISMLTITGHSLGGFLAQLCVMLAAIYFEASNVHIRSVTYDAPGARLIFDKLNCNTENNRIDPHTLDITNYVSPPNLINAGYNHIGSVYMLPDNLSITPGQVAKFHVLVAKVFFYSSLSLLVQLFLSFTKNAVRHTSFHLLSNIGKEIVYYSAPIFTFLLSWRLFIHKFHYKWLPTIKNMIYSYHHHVLLNFIRASNTSTGTIDAVEVSYFPEYEHMAQGLDSLFPELAEGKLQYIKHVKHGPMGICYTKGKNNSNTKFLPMRNVLPEARMFFRQIDKNYPNKEVRSTIFKLLDLPIKFVYNSQGALQGIRTVKDDLNIHVIIDGLVTLLHEKTF